MNTYYFIFKKSSIDEKLGLVSIYPETPLLTDDEIGVFITDAVNRDFDSTVDLCLYKAEWKGFGKLPDRVEDMTNVLWS